MLNTSQEISNVYVPNQTQEASVDERESRLRLKLLIDAKAAAINELVQPDFTLRPHKEENRHKRYAKFGTKVQTKKVRAAKDTADSNLFESVMRVVHQV